MQILPWISFFHGFFWLSLCYLSPIVEIYPKTYTKMSDERAREGRWKRVWRLEEVKEICGNRIWIASCTSCKYAHLQSKLNNNVQDISRASFLWSNITLFLNPLLRGHVHVHSICTQHAHTLGWKHVQILDPMQTCHKYHPSSFHNELATSFPTIALLMGHSLQEGCLRETETSCSYSPKWKKSLCQEETKL